MPQQEDLAKSAQELVTGVVSEELAVRAAQASAVLAELGLRERRTAMQRRTVGTQDAHAPEVPALIRGLKELRLKLEHEAARAITGLGFAPRPRTTASTQPEAPGSRLNGGDCGLGNDGAGRPKSTRAAASPSATPPWR